MNNERMRAVLTGPVGVATKLRQARGGRTTREMAIAMKWAQSRVNRIENGLQFPKDADLVAWAEAVEATPAELESWRTALADATRQKSLLFSRKSEPMLVGRFRVGKDWGQITIIRCGVGEPDEQGRRVDDQVVGTIISSTMAESIVSWLNGQNDPYRDPGSTLAPGSVLCPRRDSNPQVGAH